MPFQTSKILTNLNPVSIDGVIDKWKKCLNTEDNKIVFNKRHQEY
jgi:hypothetical protein